MCCVVGKLVEGSPRQRILKYAKQQAKYEGQLDFYPTDTRQDVHLNRALTHWLSVGSLPYNVVDGGTVVFLCVVICLAGNH